MSPAGAVDLNASAVDRRSWFRENADDIRQSLILEPRGHAEMYGSYLVDPVSDQADFGVIFVHNEGYSDHCGHGVIGLASAAVQLGWILRTAPETRVGVDAPCGFIEAFVEWDGATAGAVRFVNVPSFIWQRDVDVHTPSFGQVSGDIAYGGAFYFYVDGVPYGIDVQAGKQTEELVRFGMEVKEAANEKYAVQHPDHPLIQGVYGTIIEGLPTASDSTQANCCVFADGQVDRSPTGSGTAGRIAQLTLRGDIRHLNEDKVLVNETLIGTIFKARVLSRTKVGEFDAVVPEISGEGHIIGFSNWIISNNDPLRNGFRVSHYD